MWNRSHSRCAVNPCHLARMKMPNGMAPRCAALVCLLAFLTGCRNEMYDQPKAKPLSESTFFANGQNARPLPQGTVARGFLREDKAMYAGMAPSGSFVSELPVPLTRELLFRGRQRFDIFCSPCHGKQGNGLGMIVQRGFKQPASFHVERLRKQPIGYFFDVMTQGFSQMPSYAAQVSPEDRWAIAAYVRALQFSQHAPVADLAPDDRKKLAQAPAAVPQGHGEAK
jgi:cytochrome c553